MAALDGDQLDLLETILIDLINFDWAHEAFEKTEYIKEFAKEEGIPVKEAELLVEAAITAIATEDV